MIVFFIQLYISFLIYSNHIFFSSLTSLFVLLYLCFSNVYPNLLKGSYFYSFLGGKVLVFLKIKIHFFYLLIPELSSTRNIRVGHLYICLGICYMNIFKDSHSYNIRRSRLRGERKGIQPNYNNHLDMDRLHFLHMLEVSTCLMAKLISSLDPYNMQYDFRFKLFNLLILLQFLI